MPEFVNRFRSGSGNEVVGGNLWDPDRAILDLTIGPYAKGRALRFAEQSLPFH